MKYAQLLMAALCVSRAMIISPRVRQAFTAEVINLAKRPEELGNPLHHYLPSKLTNFLNKPLLKIILLTI